jgi:ribose/xylose/arabinose/galactoside ABC-type transport system permease subunit
MSDGTPHLTSQPGVESTTTVPLTGRARTRALVQNYAIYLVFILLVVAGAALLGTKFLSTQNFLNIGQAVTFTGFAALGMLFVTTSGGFVDLSIPAAIGGAGVITLALMEGGVPPLLAIAAGVLSGLVLGLINGVLIGVVRANPVLTTLGTNTAALGVALIFTQGDYVYTQDPFFTQIGQGRLFGIIPNIIIIVAIVAVIAHMLLTYTVFGRWVYPTGGNYAAARAAGVPVRRVMIAVFAISGTFAAIGGVLLASLLGSARTTAGAGMEFNAIAAVAIGGNSIFGGAGTVARTVIGVLIVGVLNNLMILLGIPAESQDIVKGALIAGAVFLDLRLRR